MKQVHELKIWPEYFRAVVDGSKTFEFRSHLDREFNVGDTLHLREYDPVQDKYTGEAIYKKITYILNARQFKDLGTMSILALGTHNG